MEKLTDVPLHWYVEKSEVDDYSAAELVHPVTCEPASSQLISSRNQALTDAFAKDEYCLQMDDDLVKMEKITSKTSKIEIPFIDAVREMYDALKYTPFHLAGIAPTTNPYFCNTPFGLHHFIISAMMLVKPTPLRMDSRFRLKEDYDYTIQHFQKYGGVMRLNFIAPTFQHYTNSGGVTTYRTLEVEEESIRLLEKKWPGAIRRNTKRPGQILLRLK